MSVGKNITWKKSEGRSKIIFPKILRLVGKISSEGEGKDTDIFGKKIKIKKTGMGKNIKF